MINLIRLEYFKCFTTAEMIVAPLTLLAGLNSSGKSSVIQALRILKRQSVLAGHGPCISVNGKDAKIELFTENGTLSLKIHRETNGERFDIPSDFNASILQDMQYISADRLGPQPFLPYEKIEEVGSRGEFVLAFLSQYRNDAEIPEVLHAPGFEGYSGVMNQIKGWLQFITPGMDFDFHAEINADIAYSSFSEFRAADVGFGLSYTLPILASVLINAMKKNKDASFRPILLIENPEAHLHPQGQTAMGHFLATAASCGIQIFVESHSDHLLNGIRLSVKEKKISADDMALLFFCNNSKTRETKITPVFIQEDGSLDHWPKGFFDENEKSLLRLI